MPLYQDPRVLSGEPISLDLLNTRYRDRHGHHDLIDTRAALTRWLVTSPQLKAYSDVYRLADAFAFTHIRRARDILARVHRDPHDDDNLTAFNALLVHGHPRRELTRAGLREHLDIDDPAHLVGYLAADDYLTLITDDPERVRVCDGDCGLFFHAALRNGRRRWCSNDACGNRDRARRHYERTKTAALRVVSAVE
ncbi:CGNR zinc finger domain-containing protein [Streptomyces sp. NPDC050485]|uniref:CGNR zinc finger domain-containing protein n=1 Tax=Streptomyces sp. NPDC050485 TaxID=3365617 RepID=UPI0037B15D44